MKGGRSRNAALSVPILATEREVIAYLGSAIDGEHPELVVPALKTVAGSKGFSRAARRLRMTRAELDAQVLPRGRPKLDIAMKMLGALGLKFAVSA